MICPDPNSRARAYSRRMADDPSRSHAELAAELCARAEDSGSADLSLRLAALSAGAPAPSPFAELIEQVSRDSSRVTDAQVDAVRREAGSEKAAFEIILAAAIGAGLHRWDAAANAIREADDAAP